MIALVSASSEVVAAILPRGHIAHSQFQITLQANDQHWQICQNKVAELSLLDKPK